MSENVKESEEEKRTLYATADFIYVQYIAAMLQDDLIENCGLHIISLSL